MPNLHYGYQTSHESYTLSQRHVSSNLATVIRELIELEEDDRVLDLGCGDGILERNMAQNRSFSFDSIDIDSYAVSKLQPFMKPGDTAYTADITKLSHLYSPFKYSAVVSWRVLHGIHPEYYHDIFKQVYTLLQPHAVFYVAVACSEDWKMHALDQVDIKGMNDCKEIMFTRYGIPRSEPFNVHFFNQSELVDLGHRNGFICEYTNVFTEPSGYNHLKNKENSYLFAKFIRQ
jgi:cyclopropane fatty-acyl-phospholipid synthase-like methyltransferase